jgi:ABC-2 type transport system ATP-binding protein
VTPPVIAALAAGACCLLAFDAFCLASLARHRANKLPKWTWALIICASFPWGGLAYLAFGRGTDPVEPPKLPSESWASDPGGSPRGPRSPGWLGSPGQPELRGPLRERLADGPRAAVRVPVTIEVHDLTKRFGPLTAVDHLSFTVRPGQVTGFLGPNGAGKTTTMRIILGLDDPTTGRTFVGGRPYRDIIRPLHQVGALLDASAMHPGRSAYAHVLSVAQSNGIGRRRVAEVLRVTGLESVADRRVRGFSLGMKQRLGIALALLGDPPVLMFDEPVNGLDPEGIHWIRQFFKSLAAEGRTVFVSSHLMSEMALTADHLIVIGRGRLLADMPTVEFIEANARSDVLVRSPRPDDLAWLLTAHGAAVAPEGDGGLAVRGLDAPAIADLAAGQGLPVHELTPRHASLEQAYLDITKDSTEYHAWSQAGEEAAAR